MSEIIVQKAVTYRLSKNKLYRYQYSLFKRGQLIEMYSIGNRKFVFHTYFNLYLVQWVGTASSQRGGNIKRIRLL